MRLFGFPATPNSTIAFSGGSDWVYRLRLETTVAPMSSAFEFSRQAELTRQRLNWKLAHIRLVNKPCQLIYQCT
ncbi:MAG: hypothetical protein R3C56_14350 [Pirellulaceae bacterium]